MQLKTLIQEFLISQGEQNLNKFSRYLPTAIAGLRELNMDVSGSSQVAHLPISDVDTVNLPDGYIRYTRIGLCGVDGSIHTLALNSDMCLNRNTDDCGNPKLESGVSTTGENEIILFGWDGFSDNYQNGELVGRLFGIGGSNNSNGYYRIDTARNQIQLSNLPANTTELVLEYIGSLETVDGSYEVHPFIVETLKAWLRWQKELNNPNSQLGRLQIMEKNYRDNYAISIRRFSSSTLAEWLQAFRYSNMLAPKY